MLGGGALLGVLAGLAITFHLVRARSAALVLLGIQDGLAFILLRRGSRLVRLNLWMFLLRMLLLWMLLLWMLLLRMLGLMLNRLFRLMFHRMLGLMLDGMLRCRGRGGRAPLVVVARLPALVGMPIDVAVTVGVNVLLAQVRIAALLRSWRRGDFPRRRDRFAVHVLATLVEIALIQIGRGRGGAALFGPWASDGMFIVPQERRPVSAIAEPTAAADENFGRSPDPSSAAAGGHGKSESPVAAVRVVARGKPERGRTRNVIVAHPRAVAIARAVHDDAVVVIRPNVSRQVTAVDDLWRITVDVDEAHGIDRARRRDAIDFHRHARAELPGAGRLRAEVPRAVVAAVVHAVGQDHRAGRVDRVLEVGAFDGLEIRCAVVLDGRLFELIAVHRRGLRDFAVGGRIRRLLGAGHERQRVRLGAIRRNAGKIRRQLIGRDERPRPIAAGRGVPPARQQHVRLLRPDEQEHVAVRVGDVQQSGARNRRHLRRTIRPDQFRRLDGRDDLQGLRFGVRDRLLRIGVTALVGQVRHGGRHRRGKLPGPHRIVRCKPASGAFEPVGPRRQIEHDEKRRVDGAHDIGIAGFHHPRRAVELHFHRRMLAEDDLRGVKLQIGLLRLLLLHGLEHRQELIQRERGRMRHQGLAHRGGDRLLGRRVGSWEKHARHVHVEDLHGAAGAVGGHATLQPHRSIRRLLACRGNRHRRSRRQLIGREILHLRLKDRHLSAIGHLHLQRPPRCGLLPACHARRAHRPHCRQRRRHEVFEHEVISCLHSKHSGRTAELSV